MKTAVRDNIKAYLFIAPAILLFLIFTIIPFVDSFRLSLYRTNGMGTNIFIGLKNFVMLFEDPIFIKSLKNLCVFSIGIPLITIMPMIGAKLVSALRNSTVAYVYRVIFTVTMLIPGMVFMLLWYRMYAAETGAINELLRAVGLGSWATGWLGDTSTAMYALIFMGVPWVQGMNFLIYLTGFMKIPKDHYEVARIEGAKWYHVVWYVELPAIKAHFFIVLVMAIVGVFQIYEPMLVMTKGGGPADATLVPALYLFQNAFKYGRLGYATAIGLLIFVICLILTIINKKLLLKEND